ncbi:MULTISPECIES: SDR family NAD(P)-dependent oxidoreductase [Bradyrhizobium]|nr:hypothetical protein XH89_38110 [Bradyrhizobium sp. CCBAU 53340]QOZ57125.1 hypothetical protein XH90_38550 [Bradyrhizobium sp. CCBAU 53338]QOZ64820.1 hypothetical protein XH86_40050 [Bradyrhizobium guangdongense]GGI27301.1 hypothetical protein GCM10010987_43700 [Bradyrhizobium guangdongense]
MRDVAVVTGAGRGIGRAIADALGKANFTVAHVSPEDLEQEPIPAPDRYYRYDVFRDRETMRCWPGLRESSASHLPGQQC